MYWLTRSVITSQAEIDDDDGDEGGQQHEPDRDAVDAEVVADVEAVDPGLASRRTASPRVADVEAGDQRNRDQRSWRSQPISASQRTASALLVAAEREQQRRRQTIGSQIATLSRPIVRSPVARVDQRSSAAPQVRPQLPGHQPDHAEDHHQRVPVEVAGLQQRASTPAMPPTARAEPLMTTPSMSADVAALPQARARAAARRAARTCSLNQSM